MALETDFAEEFENFRKRCLALEEKSKKDEMRCLMLETEVENLKIKNNELEGKIAAILKIIDDRTTNGENGSESLYEIMVENKVLECEKQKAEAEVCLWKAKVKELESNMKGMNTKVKEDIDTVSNCSKEVFHTQVKKRLSFEEVGCSNKKISPPTPGVIGQSPFHGIIDISDEDVSCNEVPNVKTVSGSSKRDDLDKSQRPSAGNIQNTNLEHVDENPTNEFKFTRSAKRKRAAKIVTSDDEQSYDDNAPISTLRTRHHSRVETTSDVEDEEVNENVRRRYLRRLRRLDYKIKQDKSSIDLNKTFSSSEEDEEDNDGVDESESEGESLGGFIVNDGSESVSKSDSESSDSTDEYEDVLNAYKATLEKIGRKKTLNFKWDLEGDMLSDFGKDPELCMRAVCALYRQQTEDEKESKVTIHQNERGFSQPDAHKASKLAEFLTDRVPNGDLNKTVEELKQYDSKGIKLCMRLAAKYSKQLFEIYQNREDPFFMPP